MSKRQHPILIAYLLGKWLKENVIGLVFLIIGMGTFVTYIGVAMLLISIFLAVGKWYTLTYQLEEDGVHIHAGIFTKEKTFIHYEKVQTIRTQTPLLFRLFGFTSVYIETAGGDDKPEVSIQGITEEEAEKITQIMNRTSRSISVEESDIIFSFSKKELVLAAITSGQFAVVLFALLGAYWELSDLIPGEFWNVLVGFVEPFSYSTWIFTALLLLIASWILSIFLFAYKYANFIVKKEEEGVRVFQGLLEKKEFFIRSHRIQSITIKESFVRKALGYCTVSVEVIAKTGKEDEGTKVVFPFIQKNRLEKIFSVCFSDYQYTLDLQGVSKEAKGFYYRSSIIWLTVIPTIITVGVILFIQIYQLLWLVIIFPMLGFFLGKIRAKYAKFEMVERQLVFSNVSFLEFQTIFVTRPHIQMLKYQQNIFQRRKAVSSIGVTITAGAMYSLAHIDKVGRKRILAWFQNNK